MLVEQKRIPKYRVLNRTHLIMASNNDWAAPIDFDDRRFVVLEVSEARKGDQRYFKALAEEIQNGGTEALIHHLLHFDISGFDPRELPETGPQEAKLLAKIRSLDSVGQWWLGCLESGDIRTDTGFGGTLAVPGTHQWQEGPITVRVDELYRSYVDSTKNIRGHVFSKPEFGKKLSHRVGNGLRKTKMTVQSAQGSEKTRRLHAYVLPSLTECRASLEKQMKQPGPWHEEDVDSGTAF